jgi:hypothetical protein
MAAFAVFGDRACEMAGRAVSIDDRIRPAGRRRQHLDGRPRVARPARWQCADAFTVSYALTGYLPQTVPVRPLPDESGLFGSSGTVTQSAPPSGRRHVAGLSAEFSQP